MDCLNSRNVYFRGLFPVGGAKVAFDSDRVQGDLGFHERGAAYFGWLSEPVQYQVTMDWLIWLMRKQGVAPKVHHRRTVLLAPPAGPPVQYDDTALMQHLLDWPQAQWPPEVPDRISDDLGWEPMALAGDRLRGITIPTAEALSEVYVDTPAQGGGFASGTAPDGDVPRIGLYKG